MNAKTYTLMYIDVNSIDEILELDNDMKFVTGKNHSKKDS
jgi:uncharacterized protein YlbG (UPF0298 family)